ncbi:MAG: hypothetical protein Q4P18_07255 [Methanobrevibacter sp.]|uniref:hypothetical protein n=1 Tax=Methanobrevibacter sp. TaxID=66852 RepID=UPI0026E0010A|nr:hypothetical protein [Methanobrevibacter sp.]MDO5849315.1 hypothetical protein [Methanobrevibacter sp.]
MVGMYDDIRSGVNETVEIDGYPFYAQSITGEESYNRRETVRKNILGGTQHVSRGKYIPRKFSFSTYVHIEKDYPEVYDEIFKKMVSKPCTVISQYMGGMFEAEVIIQKDAEESSPEDLKLDIDIIEIPNQESTIPNDVFTIPEDKLEEEKQ